MKTGQGRSTDESQPKKLRRLNFPRKPTLKIRQSSLADENYFLTLAYSFIEALVDNDIFARCYVVQSNPDFDDRQTSLEEVKLKLKTILRDYPLAWDDRQNSIGDAYGGTTNPQLTKEGEKPPELRSMIKYLLRAQLNSILDDQIRCNLLFILFVTMAHELFHFLVRSPLGGNLGKQKGKLSPTKAFKVLGDGAKVGESGAFFEGQLFGGVVECIYGVGSYAEGFILLMVDDENDVVRRQISPEWVHAFIFSLLALVSGSKVQIEFKPELSDWVDDHGIARSTKSVYKTNSKREKTFVLRSGEVMVAKASR